LHLITRKGVPFQRKGGLKTILPFRVVPNQAQGEVIGWRGHSIIAGRKGLLSQKPQFLPVLPGRPLLGRLTYLGLPNIKVGIIGLGLFRLGLRTFPRAYMMEALFGDSSSNPKHT